MSSLFRVSAWERVSIWRRLLCAFGRVTLLFLVVIVLGFVIYATRYQIAAKIWHWRYGYVAKMGNYDVPVPEHWYVEQYATSFLLVDTALRRGSHDGKLHTTASINVDLFRSHPMGTREMEFWLSQQRHWIDREGLTIVLEKTVRFDGEDMTCIGGDVLNSVMRNLKKDFPVTSVVSLNCASAQGLNLMFVGEPADLPGFYTWVSQIRKHQ